MLLPTGKGVCVAPYLNIFKNTTPEMLLESRSFLSAIFPSSSRHHNGFTQTRGNHLSSHHQQGDEDISFHHYGGCTAWVRITPGRFSPSSRYLQRYYSRSATSSIPHGRAICPSYRHGQERCLGASFKRSSWEYSFSKPPLRVICRVALPPTAIHICLRSMYWFCTSPPRVFYYLCVSIVPVSSLQSNRNWAKAFRSEIFLLAISSSGYLDRVRSLLLISRALVRQ